MLKPEKRSRERLLLSLLICLICVCVCVCGCGGGESGVGDGDAAQDGEDATEARDADAAEWELIRFNIGVTVGYTGRVADLAAMEPRSNLSSTGFCLASPGNDYIVYQPASNAEFTVNLEAGTYGYEWFDPASTSVVESDVITSEGGSRAFLAPFGGDAVLYLNVR